MNREELIKIKYQHESIGTLKASIFRINGFWYWVPKSIIKKKKEKKKTFKVPKWFHKKMKPSKTYIH